MTLNGFQISPVWPENEQKWRRQLFLHSKIGNRWSRLRFWTLWSVHPQKDSRIPCSPWLEWDSESLGGYLSTGTKQGISPSERLQITSQMLKVQNLRDLETLTYRTDNFLNKAISRQNWKWPHIMLLMCVVESHTTMGVQISPYLLRPVDAQSFRLAEQSHVAILYPQRISLIRSIAEPKTNGCGINCQIRQGKYCSKTTLTSTDTS